MVVSKVFIGHGRSQEWRKLLKLLTDDFGLECDEFESESNAGILIQERLGEMLNDACFAFLVMTAEDEHKDGSLHARENVIHEVGLFQERLGRKKAVVLLEQGCNEFSNLHGLITIRFPRGDVLGKREEILGVLLRERILNPDTGRGLAHSFVQADSSCEYVSLSEVDWRVRQGRIVDGPFCPLCFDVHGKRIRLRKDHVPGVADMVDIVHGGRIWYCPNCKEVFERNPAEEIQMGSVVR
jgi:hypothetical protein